MSSTEREQIPPELDRLIAELADYFGQEHRAVIEHAIARAFALGCHVAVERIMAQIQKMRWTKDQSPPMG